MQELVISTIFSTSNRSSDGAETLASGYVTDSESAIVDLLNILRHGRTPPEPPPRFEQVTVRSCEAKQGSLC